MDLDEFERRVSDARLGRWVYTGAPRGSSSDKVCVYQQDGDWQYVITDERAGVIEQTRRRFATESEALEGALEAAEDLKAILT